MSDYKEEVGSGKLWKRCHCAIIYNKINEPKSILFLEEEAIKLGEKVASNEVSRCSQEFNPSAEIIILDTETLEPTGEIVTQAKLYQIMSSLYLQTAKDRDATNG
jgi:hypothetical protein